MTFNAIEWAGDNLRIIDQTALPERVEYLELRTAGEVIDAIRRLAVRGAPAIGVTAAFGVVLGLAEGGELTEVAKRLCETRPTAVNLRWAVERVVAAAQKAAGSDEEGELALAEAHRIWDRDRESCRRIGEHGRQELAAAQRLLTHCNTGRLATAGSGTALGIVYAKAEAGEPVEVLATETRPLLQGARLTAWELAQAGIPVTLVTDGSAGPAMQSGRVDAVIVGCDRVAANGDTANKVGTYLCALAAQANGVPFYVAGPMSSFDPESPDSRSIVIEARSEREVRLVGDQAIAPEVPVWNPAFDVTPAELITAFVTDVGVLRPPFATSIGSAIVEAEREDLR
jgi:methylthioribose-1-phosphate isomerase